jgi:hypothetical protein
MPRVYTSQSDPLDFCLEHFPLEWVAEIEYSSLGDGPDGRGNCFSWNDEHPDYDYPEYVCCVCGKKLTDEDAYFEERENE